MHIGTAGSAGNGGPPFRAGDRAVSGSRQIRDAGAPLGVVAALLPAHSDGDIAAWSIAEGTVGTRRYARAGQGMLAVMRRTSFAAMPCSIARTLEVVGEWWSLLVLRDAFKGVRRFDDFQRSLGIARNILTDRLQTLVEQGVLERRRYQERPPRFEYRLTDKGRDLYPVMVALMQWGDRWAADEMGPPMVLTHKACDHDGLPVMVCEHCREQVDARAMRWRLREEAATA